jgi:mannose-6-phosphate isomerase-like protein (cupin superfamily)
MIPPQTRFQFRCLDGSLEAVAVTMPPWPGEDEALDAEPYWH